MTIDSIYKEWISSIDLTKTRVVRFPSFIFLCGGPTSESKENFESCRDIFYRYINENICSFKGDIVLAEKIFDYFKHSAYGDLLHFERDLAELSILTIIFSESPGSIAEFGSFAVIDTIQEKLLIILHRDDTDKESFIWRGPASYLKERARLNGKYDPISVYNWRRRSGKDDILTREDFVDAEDLMEAIKVILSKSPKSSAFRKSQLGHSMLLILDILKVIQLATIDEIGRMLNVLEIVHDQRAVEQHLSLLISLGFAVKYRYRNNVYYISSSHKPWLSWAYSKTATIRDVERWKFLFREYYSENQKQKYRALRSYMKSYGLIGNQNDDQVNT